MVRKCKRKTRDTGNYKENESNNRVRRRHPPPSSSPSSSSLRKEWNGLKRDRVAFPQTPSATTPLRPAVVVVAVLNNAAEAVVVDRCLLSQNQQSPQLSTKPPWSPPRTKKMKAPAAAEKEISHKIGIGSKPKLLALRELRADHGAKDRMTPKPAHVVRCAENESSNTKWRSDCHGVTWGSKVNIARILQQ